MKFKQLILNSLFWRGLYFVTVLLLNIIVSRFFGATGSGWIYYITNYFSFILLVSSFCLESGMTFFASKQTIPGHSLAIFSLLWTFLVSALLVLLLFSWYHHPGQEFTRSQFIYFAVTYAPGVLLTSFFCALFYAQQDYFLPNIILAAGNLLLILCIPVAVYFENPGQLHPVFLKLYFLNYTAQGLVLALAYLKKNKTPGKWALPGISQLKLLFRYSYLALFSNIVFFLLYRIDYWFVKNMCRVCNEADLGNYIQVSKLGQMFLLVPTIIASTIFPRTAAGFKEQVNSWLPVLSKAILFLYLLLLLFLVVTGQWLFTGVYGASFNRMYQPFIFLIPGILSLSVISLVTAYNAGKDKVKTNMIGSLIGLVVIVTGDWLFIPGYGINAAAVVSTTGYIAYLVYLLYVFNREYKVPVKDFFIPVAGDRRKLKKIFSLHEEN